MDAARSYEEMPYPTASYPQTHPDRLAVIATLFGMQPAPAERSRVLEIACADGGNLLPLAFAMPGSRFTGIDLSPTAIARGRDLAARAGLKNVELLTQDLTTWAVETGGYDYVIAHGVYAWVAPAVQDRLLALISAALAPQGVAFVSYNAYPGAHVREILREMMQYHVRGIGDPRERLAKAKDFLKFLSRAWPEPFDLRHWIGKQADHTLNRDRDNLYHDELEEHYRPVYFHQFMEHAGRHGLQYLGDSDFFEMNEQFCPPSGQELIGKLRPEQVLEKEQYMDFLKNRSFRQTLLCRRDIPLRRSVTSTLLDRFLVESRATPVVGREKPDEKGLMEYGSPRGATMTTGDPFTQRMLKRLDQAAPRFPSFQELAADGIKEADLRLLLLGLYGSSLINLRLWQPPCTAVPGPRPEASRLARLQLEGRDVVTSLSHVDLNLVDGEIRALFRLLDGTRDRDALLRELAAAGVTARPVGLEATLRQLAKMAVLTS